MDVADPDIVRLEKVSKSYTLFDNKLQRAAQVIFGRTPTAEQTRRVLKDIDLRVAKGEMVGILGVNGAGKSTLLQLITGVLQPTSGTIRVQGKVAALLELGAGFNPQWTGRENTRFQLQIAGASPAELDAYVRDVEEFADIGVYFDQPVRTYSSGMFVRVAFAASVVFAPDILIVDEALAVGDARFQNKCYNRIKELKAEGTTILLVTHSIDAVHSFCDRGIVLEGGQITCDANAQEAAEYYMGILYGNGTPVEAGADADTQSDAEPHQQDDQSHDATHREPDPGEAGQPKSELQGPADLIKHVSKLNPGQLSYLNTKSRNVGTGKARIAHVALLVNGEFSSTGVVRSGDRIELLTEIKAFEDINSPAMGIVIKSVDGGQIDLSANNMQKQNFSPQKAGQSRIYKAGFTARLAGGDYFIDLGIAEVARGTHRSDDWRIGFVHIVVASTPEFLGPADLSIQLAELG